MPVAPIWSAAGPMASVVRAVVRCQSAGFDQPWHWQCYECAPTLTYRFSHIAGTIFENTNKPLRDWFKVVHLMLTSNKGMSALQIMRFMGFGSYKTAWLMCHKIRTALVEDIEQLAVSSRLTKPSSAAKPKTRISGGKKGGGGVVAGKTAVVGAVKRKGNVVAAWSRTSAPVTLECFVREAVSHKVSLLCTDEWTGYKSWRRVPARHRRSPQRAICRWRGPHSDH